MAEPQTEPVTASTSPPPDRRVRTSTLLQMEAAECGAAALGIVLAWHGRVVPLEELRLQCGVSRDGSRASNVLRAARRYGLEAQGYRMELEQLYEAALPAILFWNMNHFVVLEGFHRGRVHLNDPARGPRIATLEELDSSFSGVVLTFGTGPHFEKGGHRKSMRETLERRLSGSRRALHFVLLCGLLLAVPGLVIPAFARVFVDEVLVAGQGSLVQPLLLGMALTAALRMALTWLQRHFLLRLETKLALTTSAQFFHHLLRLPVAYFGQRFAGEVGSRLLINDKVAILLSGRLAITLLDCVALVFFFLLMLTYDVPLTLLVVVLASLNVLALVLATRRRVDSARRVLQDEGKLTGTAMNGLRMIDTLKATGSESEFFARWAGYQAKALNSQQELGRLGSVVSSVPPLVSTLATAAVLLLGGARVIDGQLTLGMLVAYQTLLASFLAPLGSLVQFGSLLQELEADLGRLDDVLDHGQDPRYLREPSGGEALQKTAKLSGRIEVRDLTFGYSPLDPPLIEDFSLALEPGQRVALIGASGSGKSTIARLIAGLYEPWRGEILLDGVARQELPHQLVSNSLAMTDQDVFLFGGSVRDNVTLWDGTIPMHAVIQACRDAQIAQVIETRAGGYQTAIEEGGRNFSGGQRQRLEIARALVANPTMLVLDEATSALDPATEAAVDDALRRRGCTCIIIAHRLSTIRDCDEIIVLDRGRIVQRGTHEEMKGAPGPYSELIKE